MSLSTARSLTAISSSATVSAVLLIDPNVKVISQLGTNDGPSKSPFMCWCRTVSIQSVSSNANPRVVQYGLSRAS